PESPIAIGRGGSSTAVARNAVSQRAGRSSVHQMSGSSSAGAASTSLLRIDGATAIAAAQRPIAAAGRKYRRWLTSCMHAETLFPILHLDGEVQDRQYETQQHRRHNIERKIGR